MPVTLKSQRGFSLPEILLSVVLMMMVITALAGGVNQLMKGSEQLGQYRHMWRESWVQSQLHAPELPDGLQLKRVQTSQQRCVSITVTIVTPMGRQGTLSRLHCPKS